MIPRSCTLCSHPHTDLFHKDRSRSFFRCSNCGLIFVPAEHHLSTELEKARYDTHQNSSEDEGYRQFLSKILPPLLSKIGSGDRGLDYGSGPTPVLAQMLNEKGYETVCYDPFYFHNPALLAKRYDFITCTEVVEHFRDPITEWKKLINLVKKGGWLAVMTQLTLEDLDFGRWYYKNDTTHICFYAKQTFHWIADQYFQSIECYNERVVLLQC